MKKIFYLIAVMGLMFASCTKPENPNPNEEKTYSFSIGAEKEGGDTDETRVELIDGLMHWSVGDKIGMYLYSDWNSKPSIENLAMTGLHTSPTRTTTFKGLLTQFQISQLDPTFGYYHFSYYPYGSMELRGFASYDDRGAIFDHTIPEAINVRPNEFSTDNVYMFAEEEVRRRTIPITWLENGEQKWSEKKTFTYKHVMVYLRVKINENLNGNRIGRIRINNYKLGGVGDGCPLSGVRTQLYTNYKQGDDYYFTHNRGIKSYGSVPNDYVIAIVDGGMDVGDYIYIPIPSNRIAPYMNTGAGSRTLQFLFYDDRGRLLNTKTLPITTTPIYLDAGKIYDIAFNL